MSILIGHRLLETESAAHKPALSGTQCAAWPFAIDQYARAYARKLRLGTAQALQRGGAGRRLMPRPWPGGPAAAVPLRLHGPANSSRSTPGAGPCSFRPCFGILNAPRRRAALPAFSSATGVACCTRAVSFLSGGSRMHEAPRPAAYEHVRRTVHACMLHARCTAA